MTDRMASLLELKAFFEETETAKFAAEWKELSDEDKMELKALLGELLGELLEASEE